MAENVGEQTEGQLLDELFDRATEMAKAAEITTAQVFIKALTHYFNQVDAGKISP